MTEPDRSSEVAEEPGTTASVSSQKAISCERKPISLLVDAHAALGLLFSLWAALQGSLPVELLLVPVFGLTFAQTSLLGLWAVFSPAALGKRVAGLAMGVVYLEIIFSIGLRIGYPTLLVAMTTGGITAVFAVIRWRYATLQRFTQHAPPAKREGVNFSIRGLMLFTLVTAITIIGVREFGEHVWRWLKSPGTMYYALVIVYVASMLIILCSIAIGVASAWAGLGVALPMLRSIVVLLMSGILGALFVSLTVGIGVEGRKAFFYVVSMTVLQAGVLIASLLVVRSCGYRLVQRS